MKKLLASYLSVLFLFSISFDLQAQTLDDTCWDLIFDGDTTVVEFFNDTMTISLEGEVIPFSLYSTSNDTFFIQDIWEDGCEFFEVGNYLFSIENGELDFTLITDECEFRAETLDEGVFIECGYVPSPLENMCWEKVVDDTRITIFLSEDTLTIYDAALFEDYIDTLYLSYSISNDTLFVQDIYEDDCDFSVVGVYLFDVYDGLDLEIELLDDECGKRGILSLYPYVPCTVVATTEVKALNANIYPNPSTNGLFFIDSEIDYDYIEVFDMMGRKVNFKKMDNGIDLSHNEGSIFFVRLSDGSQSVTKKIYKVGS